MCGRPPTEHVSLADLDPELVAKVRAASAPAAGKGTVPMLAAPVADPFSLDALDRIRRRPRGFGPGEHVAEVYDLAAHPWEHLRGLWAAECARAHACLQAASPPTGGSREGGAAGARTDARAGGTAPRVVLPALWSSSPSTTEARTTSRDDVLATAARLFGRADGLRWLYFALRTAHSSEFAPKEKAADVKVFFAQLQSLVNNVDRTLAAGPPTEMDELFRLSLAVARQDESAARTLWDSIFYAAFKAKLQSEVDLLKGIRDARKAGDISGKKRPRDGDGDKH